MKIKAIVKEKSENDEIVFVTSPPITGDLLARYNAAVHSDLHLKYCELGRISCTHKQYILWSTANRPLGEMLSENLSRIEAEIDAENDLKEKNRAANFARMAKVFGVPVVSEEDLRNNESLSQ